MFDADSRLNQVAGQETYRYDGQGQRVQTTDADGKTTFWIYSQSGQVMYTSEARRSQNLAYLYLGNTQVAIRAMGWGSSAETIRYQNTEIGFNSETALAINTKSDDFRSIRLTQSLANSDLSDA